MSWIEEADLPDSIPPLFRALSLNNEAMEAVQQLNEALAFGNSALSRTQEEAIALVVSVVNRNRYGALTYAAFLRRHSSNSALAGALLRDYTQAGLPPSERQMLDYAVKLTLTPNDVTQADIEGLREAGFDDEKILSIALIAGLTNFMNQLACGLGVAAPQALQASLSRWLTGPAREQQWLTSQPLN